MRIIGLISFSMLVCSYLAAELPKHTLKSNSQVVYNVIPSEVDTFGEMFTEGMWYGRLRSNNFIFDWEEEVEGKTKDHYTMGIGGSFVYKSGYLNHIGFTAGLYTSQSPFHMDDEDVKYYKVGRGVMSRYKVATEGEYGLTSLAQAYLEYKDDLYSIKLGRQIFESRMTKSNDIMMIPNTFEGVSMQSSILSGHLIKAAYFTKQKLRDHETFDHLFAYDDGTGAYDKWRENDDSAMHQGITLSKLEALGIKDRLAVFEIDNGKNNAWSYLFNYTVVPELFGSATIDMGYQWKLENGMSMGPAFRYMHQFDYGAGDIGGPNLKTKTLGYDDLDSVEADLYGIRFDVAKDAWKIRAGVSKVADKADIISPWRAFPTDEFGYTLLQYNWYAGTTSYVIQADYDLKAYLLTIQARYGVQDFDDSKPGVQADSNVVQLDFNKQFESMPNLYAKVRLVAVRGDSDTIALDGTKKLNPSYNDIRFELNYLF